MVAVALGLITACLPWTGALAKAPPKGARPPKFSQSVQDTFFPDAREKLVGTRPDRATRSAGPGPAPPAGQAPAATARSPWPRLISREAVENEIKSQQIKLNEAVRSPVKFQSGDYQKARSQFSLLAILFAIDGQYGEPMRWQREAAALRERMARAGAVCKVGTDSAYREAKARAEELATLVRGESADLSGASSRSDGTTTVDRAPLMKRLEQAHEQGLVELTAKKADFSRHAEKLSHEAQLIAALAEVIELEGYEFSDDETYREYAGAMQNAAIAVRDAVDRKDYAQAARAVAEIGKACANCHEGFRN